MVIVSLNHFWKKMLEENKREIIEITKDKFEKGTYKHASLDPSKDTIYISDYKDPEDKRQKDLKICFKKDFLSGKSKTLNLNTFFS